MRNALNLMMAKYDERCAAEGMICFIPLAVDTFGGWHGAALDAIVKIEWAAAGTATWRGGGGDQALVAETVYPAHQGQYGHAGEPHPSSTTHLRPSLYVLWWISSPTNWDIFESQ